ncbi:MAG: aldo/keto reductase [SAR324 cluster bacterium]|nr:aldo/keto reductase [SAR324 cluster bacterium]
MKKIPRTSIEGLSINQLITGLWQVADIEKEGHLFDLEDGANELEKYYQDGFDTFDMADHYGSAELIAGRLLARYQNVQHKPIACTKWCPVPGQMTKEVVRKGVQERLDRLGVEQLDLLQFHWWTFQHPAWLDALHELAELRERGLIKELGVTNFDAAHLHLALADGIPIRSNQVSFSLLDRRAGGSLKEVCEHHAVKILAYGTLCGGFLSKRWLGQGDPEKISDWSRMKYRRFIESSGGWNAFQSILSAVEKIAQKHRVSVANVATKWVLSQDHVAAVIVGARLGESQHRQNNMELFEFELDDEDFQSLEETFKETTPVPGDCGDEYRKPPFLTATGDLSHHLEQVEKIFVSNQSESRDDARQVLSGSKWEDIAGYCRAQRICDLIVVSGTTATAGHSRIVARGDAAAQTTFILDKIAAALEALGSSVKDVIRTRIYLVNVEDTLAVSKAHGRVFGQIKPANTLLQVGGLVGDYLVEIEADALVRNNNSLN